MSNPMEGNMNKRPDALEALAKAKASREAFLRRNPDAIVDKQSAVSPSTPFTTEAASRQASKKEKRAKRDFPTFIEKSLPPRDRE